MSLWQMKKKIAVHAEDYDLAKKLKQQIQRLEKSLEPPPPPPPPPAPPPTPLSELSNEERHAKRVRLADSRLVNHERTVRYCILSHQPRPNSRSHGRPMSCTGQVEAVRSGIMNSRDKDHVRLTGLLADRLLP